MIKHPRFKRGLKAKKGGAPPHAKLPAPITKRAVLVRFGASKGRVAEEWLPMRACAMPSMIQ